MVVTADHSHVFTIGGYQPRGNPIFGYTESKASDNMRFTTLSYANGPGGKVNSTRTEPTQKELDDPDHRWQSLVPTSSERHGGEDVGMYNFFFLPCFL